MNRSKAGARLSAYLEGDLSESERSKMELHLADDPSLRETLREIEDVVAALRSLPEPELPAAFATRVLARVQEQRERAPRGLRVWILRAFEPAVAVPMAAGITALALVVGSYQGGAPAPEVAGNAPSEATVARVEPSPAADGRAAGLQGPTELVSTSKDPDEMTLTEIQRLTLQTILSRHRQEDLARLLRGSSHPHAPSFVSQVVEADHNLQVVSFEQQRGRARR